VRRKISVIAMSLAAVLLATVLSPAAARAAALPVINWAFSVNDDLGRLQTSISAEAGVASITAHVVSYATQQEVASTSAFTLREGTAQDGVWVTTDRFQIAQLGGYRVDMEVTDQDGQHITSPYAGELNYAVATFIDRARARPATVTYTDRDVTVSGRLRGRWPADGAVRSIGGFPMYASGPPFAYGETVTAADGTFSVVLHIEEAGFVMAATGYDPQFSAYLSTQTEELPVRIKPAATKVTAKVSKQKVLAGESVTLSGQITWKSPDGWLPLAGAQFGVLHCWTESDCSSIAYPTTDAAGRYSLTVTPYRTGWYQVGVHPDDPFKALGSAKADITVLQLTSIPDFTAQRDGDGDVVTAGHLRFDRFTPGQPPVQIQYSANGHTGWQTVATVPAGGWDGSGGYPFTATIPAGAAGWYRAVYAGTPDFFAAATGPKAQVS